MKLSKVFILFCCPNGARGVTSTFTNLALQEYKINRQIAQNNNHQAALHRHSQSVGSGQAMTLAELINLVKKAQMAADAHRRGPSSRRRFGPKVGKRTQGGTMEAFRRMQKVVGTYIKY